MPKRAKPIVVDCYVWRWLGARHSGPCTEVGMPRPRHHDQGNSVGSREKLGLNVSRASHCVLYLLIVHMDVGRRMIVDQLSVSSHQVSSWSPSSSSLAPSPPSPVDMRTQLAQAATTLAIICFMCGIVDATHAWTVAGVAVAAE